MNNNMSFYFTYENQEELDNIMGILEEIFGEYVRGAFKDTGEKIAYVKLEECNKEHLFNLLREFDDDSLRIMFVHDELIIGTERCLDSCGI